MEGTARQPSVRRYVVPTILCCVTQKQLELEHWMLQICRRDFKFGLNCSNGKPGQKGAVVSLLDPPQVCVASLFLLPIHTDTLLSNRKMYNQLSVSQTGKQVWRLGSCVLMIQQDGCRTVQPIIRNKDKDFSEGDIFLQLHLLRLL